MTEEQKFPLGGVAEICTLASLQRRILLSWAVARGAAGGSTLLRRGFRFAGRRARGCSAARRSRVRRSGYRGRRAQPVQRFQIRVDRYSSRGGREALCRPDSCDRPTSSPSRHAQNQI